jgi:hypothetical protein
MEIAQNMGPQEPRQDGKPMAPPNTPNTRKIHSVRVVRVFGGKKIHWAGIWCVAGWLTWGFESGSFWFQLNALA